MPYAWTEPAEVVSHLDVTIYCAYKNEDWNQPFECHYTTDITENAPTFDIRELESYRHDEDHITILKRAIERGEITAPPEDE